MLETKSCDLKVKIKFRKGKTSGLDLQKKTSLKNNILHINLYLESFKWHTIIEFRKKPIRVKT